MYRVRDTAGATALVAFYLDNGNAEATRLKQFKSGTTLILEQPWAKMFLDGQHGIRLEDSDVAGVTVRTGVPMPICLRIRLKGSAESSV
jgi:hypothetical protein